MELTDFIKSQKSNGSLIIVSKNILENSIQILTVNAKLVWSKSTKTTKNTFVTVKIYKLQPNTNHEEFPAEIKHDWRMQIQETREKHKKLN